MSEKKGLLPVVHEDIGKSVLREYESDKHYIEKLVRRVHEDNPCITDYIDLVTSGADRRTGRMVLESVLFVYRMLESQAEADRLTQEAGGA